MIEKFTAAIRNRGGLARPTRFKVEFTLPEGMFTSAIDTRDLSLLCESAALPGKQIQTYEWTAYGHNIKVPYSFIQEDVACVFNLTNDGYVKHVFDEWQNKIIHNTKFYLAYDADFKSNITISQLTEYGNENTPAADRPVYTVKLLRAYPLNVGQIALDNNASDVTQKLAVTFAYDDIEINDSRGGTLDVSRNLVGESLRLISNFA